MAVWKAELGGEGRDLHQKANLPPFYPAQSWAEQSDGVIFYSVCGLGSCTWALHMGNTAENLTNGFMLWEVTLWPTVEFHNVFCAPLCKRGKAEARKPLEKSKREWLKRESLLSFLMKFSTCLLISKEIWERGIWKFYLILFGEVSVYLKHDVHML